MLFQWNEICSFINVLNYKHSLKLCVVVSGTISTHYIMVLQSYINFYTYVKKKA
jgi:hypothetical protein